MLSFLIARLDMRNQQMESNVPMQSEQAQEAPRSRTDFGRFLGVIVFALFCAVPGPFCSWRESSSTDQGQEPAQEDQKIQQERS